MPPGYARIVAVEYSPGGSHALTFIAYNEPPDVEPYLSLCEKTAGGWVENQGGAGGGRSWMSTNEDGSLGVGKDVGPADGSMGRPSAESST